MKEHSLWCSTDTMRMTSTFYDPSISKRWKCIHIIYGVTPLSHWIFWAEIWLYWNSKQDFIEKYFKMWQNALKFILHLPKFYEPFSRNLFAFFQKISKISSLHVTAMVHWLAHQTTKSIPPTTEKLVKRSKFQINAFQKNNQESWVAIVNFMKFATY